MIDVGGLGVYAACDSVESFMSADPILVLVLLVLVLLPAVWFVAEFRGFISGGAIGAAAS